LMPRRGKISGLCIVTAQEPRKNAPFTLGVKVIVLDFSRLR
jgi:hypothetical protein